MQKASTIRVLSKNQLSYEMLNYTHGKEAIAGLDVTKQLEENPEQVFRTLVAVTNTKEYIVFVIPVAHELHLKKHTKVVGIRSVKMIHMKDINKITGYIRGGHSPIGMKEQFYTFVHKSCTGLPTMMSNGGKVGVQTKMQPGGLLKPIHVETADLVSKAWYCHAP